jgi:hypothetical protein
MVELIDDGLMFSFPDVHPAATLRVAFQRTLRIPDDSRVYPLPPGLGRFPVRHVDDFASGVPASWVTRGGVMLPMYQSEALWVSFVSDWDGTGYPFAIKIAAGKINAVTGQSWSNDLHEEPQDYLVAPVQPWLDGFAVAKGVIRQFVAMPLGAGYTAEEQLTGAAEHGGLQILVHPMKRECYERHFSRRQRQHEEITAEMIQAPMATMYMDMGLAPGGRMKQDVVEDPYGLDEWDRSTRSRCFVHLLNTLMWQAVTGEKPPLPPPIAATYAKHRLPWFDYYGEGAALEGGEALTRLRSVIQMSKQKGEPAVPENDGFSGERVVRIGPRRGRPQVRDGTF